MEGDDPASTNDLSIDDVTYIGHSGLVDFNSDPGWKGVGNDRDGNRYGWVQKMGKGEVSKSKVSGQGKESQVSIMPVGSRFGECQPGEFPKTLYDKKIGYAALTMTIVLAGMWVFNVARELF